MVVTQSTTYEEEEIFAAQFTDASFKDLLNVKEGKTFSIDQCMIMVPEEEEKEARMTGCLKVDGVYYKGISQKVIEKIVFLVKMDQTQQDIEKVGKTWRDFRFKMTKTAGRYGNYKLELVTT